MPSPGGTPRAHKVMLGSIKTDQGVGNNHANQDPYTVRYLYLCDSEADLPLTTESQMFTGDVAFCHAEGTWWKWTA